MNNIKEVEKGKKDLETKTIDPKRYRLGDKSFKGKKPPTVITRRNRANVFTR